MRSGFKVVPAVLAGLIAATVLMPGAANADSASRKMCASPNSSVKGVVAIYNLRATGVSCAGSRKLVRKYHAKYFGSGKLHQDARGFTCNGKLTGGLEGVIVSCKRGADRVKWTAQLQLG